MGARHHGEPLVTAASQGRHAGRAVSPMNRIRLHPRPRDGSPPNGAPMSIGLRAYFMVEQIGGQIWLLDSDGWLRIALRRRPLRSASVLPGRLDTAIPTRMLNQRFQDRR